MPQGGTLTTAVSSPTQWKMPGGMRFRAYRGSRVSGLERVPVPDQVLIPVHVAKGDALVADGDRVKTGQPLVSDVHITPGSFHLATVTGTVDRFIPHGLGMRAPTTIVIKRLGDDDFFDAQLGPPEDAADARSQLVRSGVIHACTLDVGRWLLGAHNAVIDTVVVAALATSPLGGGGADAALEEPETFRAGLALWKTAASGAPTRIAVKNEDSNRWQEAGIAVDDIDILSLENRYPNENAVILASICLGRDLPAAESPLEGGVLVIDTAAVLAAGRVATNKRPLTEVRAGLYGEGFSTNTSIRCRIGHRIGDLLAPFTAMPSKYVAGGVLAGTELSEDEPLLPGHIEVAALPLPKRRFMGWTMPAATRHSWTMTVLSSVLPWVAREAKAEVGGEERPCISCGACEEVCPRSISPSYLAKAADAELIEEMEVCAIDRCIRCGLCSYVCPSKIELLEKIIAGMDRLEAERAE
jgi:electron transport complex protein RnfC